MAIRHVDSLKKDFTELTYFIRRLEKDGEFKRLPLFQEKLRLIVDAINSIEDRQPAHTF
jgi:hypothetical protein